ncbi:response regulator [Chloroflexia bacterium SDU3-3]|nr:response regulator [Chloroflexia bacterium SDU3-3]
MTTNLVLVVDDSADIRKIVTRLLTKNGCRVIEAESGLEAVQKAHRHRPSLIVMDINLPGIDGLEVARQLRSDPLHEDVPIIAMTAYGVGATLYAARRAGIQRVIFKPFNLDALLQEVSSFLQPTIPLMSRFA